MFSDLFSGQYVGQPIELKSLSPSNSFQGYEVVGEYNIYCGGDTIETVTSDTNDSGAANNALPLHNIKTEAVEASGSAADIIIVRLL